MDLTKVLQQLHEELDNLNTAILTLERLQESGRRRGRPPALLSGLALPARGSAKGKTPSKTESHAALAGAPAARGRK